MHAVCLRIWVRRSHTPVVVLAGVRQIRVWTTSLVFLQFIFPLELLRCLACKSSISFSRALTAQYFRRKLGCFCSRAVSAISLSLSLPLHSHHSLLSHLLGCALGTPLKSFSRCSLFVSLSLCTLSVKKGVCACVCVFLHVAIFFP